jgi:hypothetical protein
MFNKAIRQECNQNMSTTTLGYAATLGGTRIWVMSFSEDHTGTTLSYAAALGGTRILAMPSSSGHTYHIIPEKQW